LVVIGASAGGVEVLRRVVAALPADLPAAVCIVLHIAPESPSALAQILERAGPLPCRSAEDGDRLEPGRILVAPPDRHLVVEDGCVRLTTGPRENGHRPSVDVLFRSAAAAMNGHVIGVVLSGSRDDGSAGLARIKSAGGAAVVQDPADALYAGMPSSAIGSTAVDVIAPSSLIADAIERLVRGHEGTPDRTLGAEEPRPDARGDAMTTICPDCGGVLSRADQAGVRQWRCRVGHRYSEDSLLADSAGAIESTMWAAIRALEDRRALLEVIASRRKADGDELAAREYRERAGASAEHATQVRHTLARAARSSLRTTTAAERSARETTQQPAGRDS
jgi:two-component system chemotaxis response regulator CheB